MKLEEIHDMVIAAASDEPVERSDGLEALAEFLYDLQEKYEKLNEQAKKS